MVCQIIIENRVFIPCLKSYKPKGSDIVNKRSDIVNKGSYIFNKGSYIANNKSDTVN